VSAAVGDFACSIHRMTVDDAGLDTRKHGAVVST
jgi:hypothetical protein